MEKYKLKHRFVCVCQAIWLATAVEGGVQLSLTSPDGDQGYPGEVQVSVTYTLQVNTPGHNCSSLWQITFVAVLFVTIVQM